MEKILLFVNEVLYSGYRILLSHVGSFLTCKMSSKCSCTPKGCFPAVLATRDVDLVKKVVVSKKWFEVGEKFQYATVLSRTNQKQFWMRH